MLFITLTFDLSSINRPNSSLTVSVLHVLGFCLLFFDEPVRVLKKYRGTTQDLTWLLKSILLLFFVFRRSAAMPLASLHDILCASFALRRTNYSWTERWPSKPHSRTLFIVPTIFFGHCHTRLRSQTQCPIRDSTPYILLRVLGSPYHTP